MHIHRENIRVPFCQLAVREFQQKLKETTWIHRLLSLISNPEGWLWVFLEQVITSGRSASSILHSRWGEGRSLWRCSWASNGAALAACTPHTQCWPRTRALALENHCFKCKDIDFFGKHCQWSLEPVSTWHHPRGRSPPALISLISGAGGIAIKNAT